MNAEELFDVVFHDAFVFDGEEALADPMSIGVRGGRIAAVSDNPLRGRETINARGRWVAPGLVESHIHLFDPQNSTDPETMGKYVRSGSRQEHRWLPRSRLHHHQISGRSCPGTLGDQGTVAVRRSGRAAPADDRRGYHGA
jgi:cytosine/adenosine deaminase-related metal-dependent hydrolase